MRRTAAFVLLFSAACGDGKPPVQPALPNGNPAPRVVRIELIGPDSIAPGRSAQFTAVARLGDGTTQPANVRWVFSNALVSVDDTGRATAGEVLGEGTLRARMSTPSGFMDGTKTILVLADGTYRIGGMVTEEGTLTAPIVGARVELTNDTRIGTLTGSDGHYRLYGVPSQAEIRITRDGYQPHVEWLQIAQHATQNFQLSPSGAPVALAGDYTLTVDVECGTTSTPVRPMELRRRTYAAVLAQTGSTLEVVLTESSRFRVNSAGRGNRFSGHADPVGATFYLQSFFSYYYPYDPSTYPDLLERVPDGTFLQIDGTAVTRSSPAGLAGELQGGVALYSSGFPQIAPGMAGGSLGFCGTVGAPPHRFTLTRR